MFQSHAGSIEARASSAVREVSEHGFQSHAGSIEAHLVAQEMTV